MRLQVLLECNPPAVPFQLIETLEGSLAFLEYVPASCISVDCEGAGWNVDIHPYHLGALHSEVSSFSLGLGRSHQAPAFRERLCSR